MKQTDLYINLKVKEEMFRQQLLVYKQGDKVTPDSVKQALNKLTSDSAEKKIPFDIIFMKYIFANNTNIEVRQKALEVLIKNFNQRDLLVKELARTELIVNQVDYRVYLNFLSKQRQLK
jgi:hypothetical protein